MTLGPSVMSAAAAAAATATAVAAAQPLLGQMRCSASSQSSVGWPYVRTY